MPSSTTSAGELLFLDTSVLVCALANQEWLRKAEPKKGTRGAPGGRPSSRLAKGEFAY